ncbi:unnamed protein product [Bursaphelenchus xylophilus]|uniref:(pine wood nematode) hypothetical protein n=1 Tax=Bursaphelenchus xylophilus TaxID=6326 RepID=A0A7I8WY89_BURXY|nr:unnamed protein product [Bursaphelenchus xylophilus]CAG9101111.1 unnamed protein product [Bursaphelenchus xylophilus]
MRKRKNERKVTREEGGNRSITRSGPAGAYISSEPYSRRWRWAARRRQRFLYLPIEIEKLGKFLGQKIKRKRRRGRAVTADVKRGRNDGRSGKYPL